MQGYDPINRAYETTQHVARAPYVPPSSGTASKNQSQGGG